ncbi:NADH dehydrogenase [ubiquinone] 1 alpha subcomplex subunit 9, mitochondrial [Homalodisca vitripennis]|uniref:NADH dehydrogenase [ubiquinone] 1 alpha subcomplex subunit 9, mitochondrial n=1 Tax=Homalodisca vitripennis TaxID=197043 RepID=UPI001EEAFBF0|nr:NADH dehydrogenase [ubiquinone] 1 alpha subcomplex subunit 9, mitochondrial [Homalodisca vitripennis]KAG8243507.1 39kDa subunit of ndufa9, NADH:ubiquinone oxidoreductase [Homalodisca vitripennis]
MAVVVLQSSLQSARSSILPALTAGVQNASYSTDSDVHPIKNASLPALKRGTGGRSSFNGVVATVFGASGFLGRYVCNKLGKVGSQLIIPYRGDHYDVLRLKLCGDLGQVLFQTFDPKDMDSYRKCIKYSNVVINLIGRDWETKNYTYHDVNVKIPRTLAKLCKEAGVEKFIHISHLNAAERPEPHMLKEGSKFLATKWEGEQAVREEFPGAIIFKPSDIYGSEDRFLRSYAHFWRHTIHWLPMWKKGEHTIKQPVFVSDVAAGISAVCKERDTIGQTYQAVGPKRYLLSDLVDYFHSVMRKDKKNWGYWRYDMRFDPFFKMRVMATEMMPGTPIASLGFDKLERECISDCVMPGVPTLEDLGVTLTQLEDQVPWELKMYRAFNYYEEQEGEFETPIPPPAVP